MNYSDATIGIVGLGYVGLPLAVEFGRKRPVIGLDVNEERIKELENGVDKTHETTKKDLKDSVNLSYTSKPKDLKECKIFIITVPTPINKNKQPDLRPLQSTICS